MIWISLMAVMTGGGALLADRMACFRNRTVLTGVWFGLLAIVANTVSTVAVEEYGIAVGLRDAPPVVAALFFGPVAGVVAGAIAAAERALTPIWGVGTANLCPLATLLTALFAAGVGRFLLDGRRPELVQAVLLGAFAEIVHLAFDYLFCFGHYTRFVEIYFAAVDPESVGLAVSAGLASVACRSVGTWRSFSRSTLSILLVAFAAAFGTLAFILTGQAARETDTDLRHAAAGFEADLDDQIGYILHGMADSIADRLGTAGRRPAEDMRCLAEAYDVDEVNVYDAACRPLASTDPVVLAGPGFTRDNPNALPYFELAEGKRGFVRQRFRRGIVNPVSYAKYVAVPFGDRSGILQVGYSWKRLENEFSTFFFPMLTTRTVGDTGFFLVTDGAGIVQTSAFGHEDAKDRKLSEIGLKPEAGGETPDAPFSAHAFGVWSRCLRLHTIGPWRIYAVLPVSESQAPALATIFLVGFLLFLFCLAFHFVMVRFRRQQAQIEAMRAKDLTLAKTIQTSSLPMAFPHEPTYDIYARMDTAREVGGDFYDFYLLPSGRVLFLVADVSGKGVPAALFMMRAKATIRAAVFGSAKTADLAAAVAEANDLLADKNEAEMFITAWIGVCDLETGEVEFVNAGHNPPLVKHADGTVTWVRERGGLVLAAMSGIRYRTSRLVLRPGDSLFLYTDGVTEAMNEKGGQYGESRLEAALKGAGRAYVEEIRADITAFARGAEQSDDITMLAFDLKQERKQS